MERKQVLIPVDGSEHSLLILPHVKQLLAPKTHHLILLQVTAEPGLPPTEGTTLDDLEVYAQWARRQRSTEISAELLPHTQPLLAAGFTVSVEVRFGDPVTEIERYMASADIQLIAMTTHGRSAMRTVLLGSVAQYLLRHTSVPLLLYRSVDWR